MNRSVSPLGLLTSAWKYRQLIFQMSKREIAGRYRGSLLGVVWSFLNPLLMLAVYTVFFTIMLGARWGVTGQGEQPNYTVVLFVGLLVHMMFAECVNRAPMLVVQNVNFVKKIVFPLEVLPWVTVLSALFHMGIGFIALLLVQIVVSGSISWTLIFFPLVILPFICVIMGLMWFLSALGVYIRDIGQVTGMLVSVLLFMSPVFYSVTALPERIRPFLMLNPLTFIIEQSREVLVYSRLPDFSGLIAYSGISLFIAWMGYLWFQKTRAGFADVL